MSIWFQSHSTFAGPGASYIEHHPACPGQGAKHSIFFYGDTWSDITAPWWRPPRNGSLAYHSISLSCRSGWVFLTFSNNLFKRLPKSRKGFWYVAIAVTPGVALFLGRNKLIILMRLSLRWPAKCLPVSSISSKMGKCLGMPKNCCHPQTGLFWAIILRVSFFLL